MVAPSGLEAVPDSASTRHIVAPGGGDIMSTPCRGGACWQALSSLCVPEATSSAGPPALAQVHRLPDGGEGGSQGNEAPRKPKLHLVLI